MKRNTYWDEGYPMRKIKAFNRRERKEEPEFAQKSKHFAVLCDLCVLLSELCG
jgi:hypothetical protein